MSGKYERNKPHVNVGTIGHIDHGKTTLTTAVLTVQSKANLAQVKSYAEIAKGGVARAGSDKILTVAASHVEYETEARHYAHVDCPGHKDYIKNMITGAAQMDGAILVVSSVDGPMTQTREHILLAKQVGVPKIVVFINLYGDKDDEMLELIKEETKDLLKKYGFDDNCPFVVGSALKAVQGDPEGEAAIKELLKAIDEYIPLPERAMDQDFLLAIEGVHSIEGRGTVATGRVERGKLKLMDALEVLGHGIEPKKTVATGIEMFHKQMDECVAGDNVGVLLRGVDKDEISRGMVLVKPGSAKEVSEFKGQVYILTKDENGREKPFVSGYKPQFFIRTADITGEVTLPEGIEMVKPGDNVEIIIKLLYPAVVEKGMRFAFREGGLTVGSGVVTEIIK